MMYALKTVKLMKYYSQKKYKERLGFCNTTIAKNGCYLVSLAMLTEIDPLELNRRIKVAGGYSGGCMINSQIVAKELKTFYNRTKDNPKVDYPIIAETDHYKRVGFKQHFFVLLPDGRRVDPLDLKPKPEYNNYNIVSYRDFHITSKKTMAEKKDITKEIKKASKKYLKVDCGKRISSAEDKKAAKAIKTLYNSVESLMKEHSKILSELIARTNELKEEQKKVEFLAKKREEVKSERDIAEKKLGEIEREYADKLEEARNERDIAEREVDSYKMKLNALNNDFEILAKDFEKLNEKNTNQAKEITRLKAVNEKNATEAKFWNALKFAIKALIS